MNILVYDVAASESGALSVLTDFYKQILDCPMGSCTWIFTLGTAELPETEHIKVLRFPWVKRSLPHRVFFDYVYIKKILRLYKIDAVVSLQNTTVHGCRMPQVISLHNTLPLWRIDSSVMIGWKTILKQRVINRCIIRSIQRAAAVIVPAEWIKQQYAQKANVEKDRFYVASMAIDTSNIEACNSLKNIRQFFYPATAYPYKRHNVLLDASALLRQQGKDAHILLTINGSENPYAADLKKTSEDNQLDITFGGMLPRREVFKRYVDSVLVFPSVIETDALPLIEARRTGTYIIASDTLFSREILQGYPNCAFFDDGDAAALSSLMNAVLEGKVEWQPDTTELSGSSVNRAEICQTVFLKERKAP